MTILLRKYSFFQEKTYKIRTPGREKALTLQKSVQSFFKEISEY